MSSAEAENNLRLIQEAFERWNSGDRKVDLGTIDPEVELHTPLGSTRGAPYRGHEGFAQWIADIDDQFEDWEVKVREWRHLDDGRLLGLGEIHARGRGSGLELNQPLAWLFAFRDGKVVRYDAFYDEAEGLRVAGLGA
jgi:ketosteroid isomerase-like protein